MFTTTQEALQIILDQTENFGTTTIDLKNVLNHILKDAVTADRDLPPFNRVCMDGIAIDFEKFNLGQRVFNIEGIQAAGAPQLTLNNVESCLEVMTGAVLPENATAVIPYELVNIQNEVATINTDRVTYFQNIHLQGKDRKVGDKIIPSNTVISPSEIGVLATVGCHQVKVAKPPKVAIISTGDELVNIDEVPLPHQIRKSNVYTLYSVLQQLSITAEIRHLYDDETSLNQEISKLLDQFDVLLFSGAVSKGKFDFLPKVLEQQGVKKFFHRVNQRPGKPFWFGKKQHRTVFAFPGNPISTFVCCLKYFVPWYQKSMNQPINTSNYAILTETIEFNPELTYFLQVKLSNDQGKLYATPIKGNGSGDLANLVKTDAFIELPSHQKVFKKEEAYPILKYRI